MTYPASGRNPEFTLLHPNLKDGGFTPRSIWVRQENKLPLLLSGLEHIAERVLKQLKVTN